MSQVLCIETLTSVSGLDQLRAMLAEQIEIPVLTIRVGEPVKIDVAALQLLASFVQAQKTKGYRTQWLDVSAFFKDSARLSGFSGVLGLD